MDKIIKMLTNIKTKPSEEFESETIEFKNYSTESALHNAKDLVEEISALANTKGGIIIIGIIDSSNIRERDWLSQLNGFDKVDIWTTKERILGKLNPKIPLELNYLEFETKNYLLINIPKYKSSIVSTTSGKIFIREGKSSRPALPNEVEQLVKSLTLYDWSSEDIDVALDEALNKTAVQDAKIDFCQRRRLDPLIEDNSFLESIGATKNGILNKAGLLFLGNTDSIKKHLGNFEYRFSWKTKTGDLIINDIWEDCLWLTIKKAKLFFSKCNSTITVKLDGQDYELTKLDDIAFHEAYLNALVHRDYSHDGMVSVNFTGQNIYISNPGIFYGGVNRDNILYHEPRHRNKGLAKMLMLFNLVDRAGMGISRMGIRSLMYGRSFPEFEEKDDYIVVTMQAEYFRAPIFVITQRKEFDITGLFILNCLYEKGTVAVKEVEKKLQKILLKPWEAIVNCVESEEFSTYGRFIGSKKGVVINVSPMYAIFFNCNTKSLKLTKTGENYVSLYKYFKKNKSASNEEIMKLIGIKYTSQTSAFLKSSEFVTRKGNGPSSKWYFVE